MTKPLTHPLRPTLRIALPPRRFDPLPPLTGRLGQGAGRILVLADLENLVLSARDYGVRLDFAALREAVCPFDHGHDPDCHAVYSAGPDDGPLAEHLSDQSWSPIPRPPIRRAGVARQVHLNADTWFAFAAARLASQSDYDTIVLGTGDGLLGLDVARCLRALIKPSAKLATLSFAGCTSHLLDARAAPEIGENLTIGRDVVKFLN